MERWKNSSRKWIRSSALSCESEWINARKSSIFKASGESKWSVIAVKDCSKLEFDLERESEKEEKEEEWKVVDSWRIWETASLESAKSADCISESIVCESVRRVGYRNSEEEKRQRKGWGELSEMGLESLLSSCDTHQACPRVRYSASRGVFASELWRKRLTEA